MRKLLLVLFPVLLLNETVTATEKDVVVQVTTTNILDKLIAMVNDYTKRADEALSMEELQNVYAEFEQAMASFLKDNADEIAKFDTNLTDTMKEKYEAELSKAVKQFKTALERRAMKLIAE